MHKLDAHLAKPTMFQLQNTNNIPTLRTYVNKLIKSVRSQSKEETFSSIIGEYQPVYLYDTVKTHKTNNPLRPIISQIPTQV